MPERRKVSEQSFRGELQEIGIVAEKTAGVELCQPDIKVIALKLLEVVAADFRGLGGFADGDALFCALPRGVRRWSAYG
jgi:hypothetical protein